MSHGRGGKLEHLRRFCVGDFGDLAGVDSALALPAVHHALRRFEGDMPGTAWPTSCAQRRRAELTYTPPYYYCEYQRWLSRTCAGVLRVLQDDTWREVAP